MYIHLCNCIISPLNSNHQRTEAESNLSFNIHGRRYENANRDDQEKAEIDVNNEMHMWPRFENVLQRLRTSQQMFSV
jgi:hypothetical protein